MDIFKLEFIIIHVFLLQIYGEVQENIMFIMGKTPLNKVHLRNTAN